MSFEDRLRAHLEHAGATVPVAPLDLEATLRRGRRARRTTFAVAAGAAAIAIGLGIAGASALSGGRFDRPGPPAGKQTPRPTETPAPTNDEVTSLVRSWLEAVQNGDEDAAWALMSERARSEVGRARFDQLMASSLPEGLGAFAAPGIEVQVTAVGSSDAGTGLVATLTGTVEQEGTRAFNSQAIPLLIEEGRLLVDEVFDDRYQVTTVDTSASLGPIPFRRGDGFDVEVNGPGPVARVLLSIDGPPAVPSDFDPQRGRAVVKLDRTLQAGRHVATIVVVEDGGRMFPTSRIFEAAAP